MAAIVVLILLVLVFWFPQWWVRRTLGRYHSQDEANFPGNGAELARHLLNRFGLDEVKVETSEAGDHYDPQARAVRLTPDKFERRTLTSITVAAHEVGHALQDAAGEPMFIWRTRLAKWSVWAQGLGSFLLFAAPVLVIVTRVPAPGILSALAAFLVIGFGVLVQLVTLPVELDASFRKALPLLADGYLSDDQLPSARRILKAAAFTYVAASLGSLLNFWRWLQVLRR